MPSAPAPVNVVGLALVFVILLLLVVLNFRIARYVYCLAQDLPDTVAAGTVTDDISEWPGLSGA